MTIRNTLVLLSALLSAAPGSPAAEPSPPAEAATVRLYDVAALVAPGREEPVSPVGFFPLLGRTGFVPRRGAALPALDAETISDLTRAAVGAERFEAAERFVNANGTRLLVGQAEENHERVRRFLSYVEAATAREARVRLDVLDVGPTLEGCRRAILSPGERDVLLRSPGVKVLATYTAAAPLGARMALGSGTDRRMLVDYNVEIAQSARIGDPVVATLRDGFSAAVRVTDCGAGFLDVEATAEAARLERPVRTAGTAPPLGRIDFPAFDAARAGGTATVPNGGSLLLVAAGPDSRPALVVVVGATVEGQPIAPFPVDGDRPSELRLLDPGSLGYSARSLGTPLARIDPQPLYGEPSPFANLYEEFALESEEAASRLEFHDDVQFVAETVAMALESDPEAAFSTLPNGRIAVTGRPESQAAVASRLADLFAARRRMVETTVAVVELLPGESAAPEGAAADALLAAARARRDGTTLFVLPALSGDRAAASRGREFSYLAEFEVEVAHSASIANPVIAHDFSGAALEVRAARGEGGSAVVLDVSLRLGRLAEPQVTENHGSIDLGPLDLPAIRRTIVARRFRVESGRPAVSLVGQTDDGRPVALVVSAVAP